jgi:hypothetical protein
VQHHLQTVPPMISRRVVERQLNAKLLLPDPTWPNDTTATTAASMPNALRRESIADILYWLVHGRTETCVAIVCHYHVIRAAVLSHQVIAANEMTPTTRASMTTTTTTTPIKMSSQTDDPTMTTPPPPNNGRLATTMSSPDPRYRRQATANLRPTNACLWRCDLNCATGRLTLVQVIR